MRNQSSLADEYNLNRSPFNWWRTLQEFDENGQLKVDLSDLSKLTPRLKVLREMERMAMIASEGLDDLRHKLIVYRSGDFWLPIGGIKKEDFDIPTTITILLVGLSSSGKSSLINFMYSILGRSGLIPFAQTSSESSDYTTMYMEEHNVLRSLRSGFCVYDTRGLDYNYMSNGIGQVNEWMIGGVRHNLLCCRAGDQEFESMLPIGSQRFARRKVNCVVVVANLDQIHKGLNCGDLMPLEATKQLFHSPSIRKSNENPILILTHGDKLSAKERISARIAICEHLGISETNGAYDIACLTEQGILPEEYDPVSSFALTEAVYRALMQADRAHVPKRKFIDKVVLALSWVMYSIGGFFAMLAFLFSKLGHKHNKLKM